MKSKTYRKVGRLCKFCISKPENFSNSIMPLRECFKYKFHVHKDSRGYFIFKDIKQFIKDLQSI